MIPDDLLLPISGLQHLLFCERQCALIHVEGLWAENRLTAEGRALHEAPDRGEKTGRDGVTTLRGVALRSERLGLFGYADVVEYPGAEDRTPPRPFPVEYKRGRRSVRLADDVQLCAQAMCLEEMLGVSVAAGAVFHGASRHRRTVTFDESLRQLTESTARRFRRMVEQRDTPRVPPASKCRSCSLRAHCLPKVTAEPGLAGRYLAQLTGREP